MAKTITARVVEKEISAAWQQIRGLVDRVAVEYDTTDGTFHVDTETWIPASMPLRTAKATGDTDFRKIVAVVKKDSDLKAAARIALKTIKGAGL